jgi:hypothetical protein
MTDKNHPITPPQWQVDAWCKQALAMGADVDSLFVQAYQAGADQELEACCELLVADHWETLSRGLRTARRTKPPSLKELALAELDLLKADATTHGLGFDAPAIRRALEQLDD